MAHGRISYKSINWTGVDTTSRIGVEERKRQLIKANPKYKSTISDYSASHISKLVAAKRLGLNGSNALERARRGNGVKVNTVNVVDVMNVITALRNAGYEVKV